jgi:hypothetical protein
LKEQEKKEQQGPVAKKAKMEIQLFQPSRPIQLNICNQKNEIKYLPVKLLPLSSFPRSVFHPPAV